MLLKVKLKHNLKANKYKIHVSDLQKVMKLIRYRNPRRAAQIFWRTVKIIHIRVRTLSIW